MVIPIPIPSTERVSYAFSTKGIHISKDTSTWWIYFLVAIVMWFAIGWSLPNFNVGLALIIAVCGSIVIVKFGLLRSNYVQQLLHTRRIVPWDAIEKAEMNGNEVKFILRFIQKVSYGGEKIQFFIKPEKAADAKQFLSTVLSERFVVKK
jgi:hypothetical protein